MTDTQYLDGFIGELLHINEVADNKLIDLNAGRGTGTYVLTHTCIDLSAYALTTAAERIGKTGNTILLNSALSGGEQRVNRHLNTFEWKALSGGADVKALHACITKARKDLIARGNNPLFLSVGALKWRVAVREQGKDVLKDVISPLLIFPVKLIVSGSSAPVAIEFIDDEIYINPCLIAKLSQIFGEEVANGLPKIGGADLATPVDLSVLGNGSEYFKAFSAYIDSCNHTDGADSTKFEFDKDFIAIAQYQHDELCTYYDIRRNKEKIYSHSLVGRLFSQSSPAVKHAGERVLPDYVLQRDSVQENIITRAVNGESLIVKGPPGTGKTVTIANMLASLLSQNKKVLFASKKISALTEVYAKLPEKLRKFTMLLDSETESAAAKIRPEEIKLDFKKLLAESKQYREPTGLDADIKQAVADRAKAMRSLSAYIELMFNDKCIADDNFYNALNAMCKLEMPVIEFADGNDLKKITRVQYNDMLAKAGEAQKSFEVLGKNGAYPVYKCPWFGIDLSCDTEGAMAAVMAIGEDVIYVLSAIESGLKEYGLNVDKFTLGEVSLVTECAQGGDDIVKLATDDRCGAIVEDIAKRLNDYTALPEVLPERAVKLPDGEKLETAVIKLGSLKTDSSLTAEQVECIRDNGGVFFLGDGSFIDDGAMGALLKLADGIKRAEERMAEHIARSHEVFKNDLSEEQLKLILSAGAPLSAYYANCPEKPKFMDFKAKKAYKNLCALSFLSSPSLKDIAGATEQYCKASDCQREIDATIESMYKIFHRQLTKEQVECVRIVVNKCAGVQTDVRAYVKNVTDNCDFILQCLACIDVAGKNTTVGEISARFERAYRLELLSDSLKDFNAIVSVYGDSDRGNEVAIARSLLGAFGFVKACKEQGATVENTVAAVQFVRSQRGKIYIKTANIINALKDFGAKYFRSYYVINGEDNCFGDLKILAGQAGDRDAIAAAARYTALKNNPANALDLGAFLYWFEKGGHLPEGADFKDAFEHSFFALSVRYRDGQLGIMRNGMGAYVKDNLDKLKAADDKLCELNGALIESKCLSRIKPDEDDYIFVQDRNPNENLRLMFKRRAKAILKLKRCLILSPYTASLLFKGEEFEDFDVLIVDEASQMEPALVLPVLFRSKQCIIVGDEWQMPPIKHFATLAPVQDDGDAEGYGALESEISVLGLALRNEGFPVEELICHYRSKTESLIKYSQEAYYPNMRTFPAPIPARLAEIGVPGLGLKDVYVPEGFVKDGKNDAEAQRVVDELRLHFDNYYDEKTHKLSLSVGVVAFGEAQCSNIEAKVRADTKLYSKIQSALEHFDDLPEKLVFFKTIETVQGQETGHLILSITHGKRENGVYMHFGQLNQGKLGKCIFNVAVTRAQYMVTVIHSVRAAEITNSNVEYIRNYLETAARFSQGNSEQFLSEPAGNGFINEVAEFAVACGIKKERVVVNYGVTKGSVRIPVAILDRDLKKALLGIWCEKPVGGRYDFLDYNMRYKNSLEICGWKVHGIFIHDWTDNREKEQQALEKVLSQIINEEENI